MKKVEVVSSNQTNVPEDKRVHRSKSKNILNGGISKISNCETFRQNMNQQRIVPVVIIFHF